MDSLPQCRNKHARAELSAEVRQRLAALRPTISIGGSRSYRLCVQCGFAEPLEPGSASPAKRADWVLLRQRGEGLVLVYFAALLIAVVLLVAYNTAKGNLVDAWEAGVVAGLLIAGWCVATYLEVRWLELLKSLLLPEPVVLAVARRKRVLIVEALSLVLAVLAGVLTGHHWGTRF